MDSTQRNGPFLYESLHYPIKARCKSTVFPLCERKQESKLSLTNQKFFYSLLALSGIYRGNYVGTLILSMWTKEMPG